MMQNILFEAKAIIKTVAFLGEKFSLGYISSILIGDVAFLKNENHQQLATFGLLPTWREHKLALLVDFLVQENYLYIKENNYGTLGLGSNSLNLLNQIEPLCIDKQQLTVSQFDYFAVQGLRLLRKVWADKENQPSYYVFTDFMLYEIIKQKPKTITDLKKIAGFESVRTFRYGISILETMREVEANLEALAEIEKDEETQKAYYQSIKYFFETGLSLEGIATQRKIKRTTVCRYLVDLHETQQIDLRPWIEQNIYPTMLERAKRFFDTHPSADLNEAHIALGFDYDTLRFCKVYAKEAA